MQVLGGKKKLQATGLKRLLEKNRDLILIFERKFRQNERVHNITEGIKTWR